MTDKEIEKALEVCPKIISAEDHCGECPYFQKHKPCIGNIEKDALDYINRLKADNARLTRENEETAIKYKIYNGTLARAIEEAGKEKAKEILQRWYDDAKHPANVRWGKQYVLFIAREEYGVEVDE